MKQFAAPIVNRIASNFNCHAMLTCYTRKRGYEGKERDPHMTIGKTYIALGIVFRPAPHTMQVSIHTDAEHENLHMVEAFQPGASLI